MQDDRFFLIVPHGVPEKYQVLYARQCSYADWRDAPRTHENFTKFGVYDILFDRPHGRRMNDEVELFAGPDGKVSHSSHFDGREGR